MNKIRPLYDKILIKRLEQEQKSSGGIIIPDTAQEKPIQGIVIAVGDGARDDKGNKIALEVRVGDKVLFAKWGGTEIKLEGEEYIVMKESDILAVIQ